MKLLTMVAIVGFAMVVMVCVALAQLIGAMRQNGADNMTIRELAKMLYPTVWRELNLKGVNYAINWKVIYCGKTVLQAKVEALNEFVDGAPAIYHMVWEDWNFKKGELNHARN